MKYDHAVKINGRYYNAFEEVPEISDNIPKIVKSKYTKTEINRMSTAELQNLAASEGIDNAYETVGGELKKILIEHFNLN